MGCCGTFKSKTWRRRFRGHVLLLLTKVRRFEIVFAVCKSVPLATLLVVIAVKTNEQEPPQATSPVDMMDPSSYSWLAGTNGTPTIMYAPRSPVFDARMEKMKEEMQKHIPGLQVRAFFSEDDILDSYRRYQIFNVDENYPMAVIFYPQQENATPHIVSYTLRPTARNVQWNKGREVVSDFRLNTLGETVYFTHSFLYVQLQLDRAIIKNWNRHAGPIMDRYTFYIQSTSALDPCRADKYARLKDVITGYKMCLAFAAVFYTFAYGTKRNAEMKVLMRLNGCSDAAHWTALLLGWYIGILAYVVAVPAALTKTALMDSQPSLFFLAFLLHSVCLVAFLLLACICFARRAKSVLFVIAVYLVPIFLNVDKSVSSTYVDQESTFKTVASYVFFEVAFSRVMSDIAELEFKGTGAAWSGVLTSAWDGSEVTIFHGMSMMLVDALLMAACAWYFNKIGPIDKIGGQRALPWDFIFKRNFWCGPTRDKDKLGKMGIMALGSQVSGSSVTSFTESSLTSCAPLAVITDVYMKFEDNMALASVSLELFQGQILAMVGSSRAGKSTLISVVSGVMPPTSGRVTIFEEVGSRRVRNPECYTVGVCPQNLAYFPQMTVEDHLVLFAKLRGMKTPDAKNDARNISEGLGLSQYMSVKARNLCECDQRMLCIAIAFVGHAQVVLLDEPTADLDPDRHRTVLAFLRNQSDGRAILVTFSNVEEAELVGDRVTFIVGGVIKCCGSPAYIKKIFSAGSHLTVVKEADCDSEAVTEAVKTIVTTARVEDKAEALRVWIPERHRCMLPKLMSYLEQHMLDLRLSHCDIDSTTMEEVFVKLNAPEDEAVYFKSTFDLKVENLWSSKMSYKALEGFALWVSHFKAMFMKKIILSWRYRIVLMILVCVPLLPGLMGVIRELKIKAELPDELLLEDETVIKAFSYNGTCVDEDYDKFAQDFRRDTVRHVPNVPQFFQDALEKHGPTKYAAEYAIGADYQCYENNNVGVTAYYNPQGYHHMPRVLSYVMNAAARAVLRDTKYAIRTFIYPLPQLVKEQKYESVSTPYSMPYLFILGISLMFGAMALQQIREASGGAKRLQMSCGVHPAIYWLSSFVWDLMIYLIPTFSMFAAIAGSEMLGYTDDNLGVTLLLLMLYGWASIPTVYAIQLWFKSATYGVVSVVLWSVLGSTVVLLAETYDVVFSWVAKGFLPHFCFYQGMQNLKRNSEALEACYDHQTMCRTEPTSLCCKGCSRVHCVKFQKDPISFDVPGVASNVLILLAQGIVAFLLTLAIESMFARGRKKGVVDLDAKSFPVLTDSDVYVERKRVASLTPTDDLVMLSYLTKSYDHKVVVNNVCLGVGEGEFIGLLGKRGAGRSTLLNMLVGKVAPDSGDAYIQGRSVRKNPEKVAELVSYCVEDDLCVHEMKVLEVLCMVARLRGVPPHDLDRIVGRLILSVGLEDNQDSIMLNLSRSNKRKLSVAIALMSPASILLLDSPTDGMDRSSRRTIWQTLASVHGDGKTVIIATNSLKECEALCTRFALLVNGSFVCLGSPRHLQYKYSIGYLFEVQMDMDAPAKPVMDFLAKTFPEANTFQDVSGNVYAEMIDYLVPVSFILEALEALRTSEVGVEDYILRRISLDRVVHAAGKAQVPPSTAVAGRKKSFFAKVFHLKMAVASEKPAQS